MTSLLDVIKQAGVAAVGASNPVNVLYGVVTKTNPLEVNVDQRFTLSADFLIVTEQLHRYEVELKHSHYYEDTDNSITTTRETEEALPEKIVIRKGLELGDKLLLLRIQGGQKYVILDKVVEL